ncbi:MAG: M23 family metallopeptidase [Prolixibacteraceae bacterium]
MNNFTYCLILLVSISFFSGCKKESDLNDQFSGYIGIEQNYVPYKTEKYLRICYMLKTWEYEKEGLNLQRIVIFNKDTKTDLITFQAADFPVIYKDPLPQSTLVTVSKLDKYYFSIQVPIPFGQTPPANISHKIILRDTIQNKEVTFEGGTFQPRTGESPRLISSPHKGKYWIYHNQSSLDYHYWYAAFIEGSIYTSEKFAFDTQQTDEKMVDASLGDPKKNESYFNYKDTLYAVASGKVIHLADGRPENSGDARDMPLKTADEYAGNYLILDIGGSCYAVYAHCVPNKFVVKVGDTVSEGQPLGLCGNSGNSMCPHLHFQLIDKPDFYYSQGLPFVFKEYTKIGEVVLFPTVGIKAMAPVVYTNANMENFSIANFK